MPQPCPSTDDATDATLVSEDSDVIDVIKVQSDQLGHYNSKVFKFSLTDLCKLFLQYPDFQRIIVDRTEEAFFLALDDIYRSGVDVYRDSDNINR